MQFKAQATEDENIVIVIDLSRVDCSDATLHCYSVQLHIYDGKMSANYCC